MSDRELLELAAKAASQPGGWIENEHEGWFFWQNPGGGEWNPISNDGDALRLAVKLRICIEINERSVVASWLADCEYETKDVYEYPDSIQDNYFDIVHVNHEKATRRAIVRAAAEISRHMQEGGAA